MSAALLAWFTHEHLWALFGGAGQALFASRFLVQWIQSEREGRSVLPVAFWYFSLGGGTVTLAYAIHLGSAAFTIGQAGGLVVYCRNLYLVFRERAALRRAAELPGANAA